MHIIYNFKAFEKGFQINVNASRNISNTFQSTLKKRVETSIGPFCENE